MVRLLCIGREEGRKERGPLTEEGEKKFSSWLYFPFFFFFTAFLHSQVTGDGPSVL